MKTITDVLTHVSKRAGKAGAAITLFLLILFVGLLVVMGSLHAGPPVAQAVGEPGSGTARDVVSHELYPATALDESSETTFYTDSPNLVGSSNTDVSKVKSYNEVDVFFNLEVGSGAAFTGTVQFSPDGDTWADAWYTYVSDDLVETTTVLTSDGVITVTNELANTSSVETEYYRSVFTADGTDVLRVPIAGERIRIQGIYTGAVTPTVWITLRNN